jgi:putative N6-adenine-specific DNA methylase
MDQERVFLTIIPGLEELALEEIKLKAPLLATEATIHTGGIELKGNLNEIHSLQAILKIPTRFLWRVLEFKARDLPKVYQKIKKHPWRQCFQQVPDRIHCHSERSRLLHTNKIIETVQAGIHDSLIAQAPKKREAPSGQPGQLYIRVMDDIFTLSRDLSGIALHYRSDRGEISSGHEASVRRTLAAAMFMSLWPKISQHKKIVLIDPMMGSGTLLEEAKDFFKPSPRQFAGDLFLKRAQAILVPRELEMELIGIDLKKPRTCPSSITFHHQDCFTFEFQDKDLPVYILSNPPYGERIEKKFEVEQLLSFYFKKLPAKTAVFLSPRSWDIKSLTQASCLKTRNSGLAVHLWLVDKN